MLQIIQIMTKNLYATLVRTKAPLAVIIKAFGDTTPHLPITASRRGAGVVSIAQKFKGEDAGCTF